MVAALPVAEQQLGEKGICQLDFRNQNFIGLGQLHEPEENGQGGVQQLRPLLTDVKIQGQLLQRAVLGLVHQF